MLLIYVAIVLAACILYALFLNWILGTTLGRYLISSAIIGLISFLIIGMALLYTLPPLRWVNEVPQDLRTTLWDHSEIVSGVAAFACVSLWQIIARRKQKRTLVNYLN
jgi:hypothetical protein